MNEETRRDGIAEQIELMVQLMKVSSSIRNNVTEDYTLAFFGKDEKDFISENYQNAEYAKDIIGRYGKKGKGRYKFNDIKGEWEKDEEGKIKVQPLTREEIERILKVAERTFEFFMVQPHMIAILNRNKGENFLVKLLGKQQEEEKPVVFSGDDRSILQKIKDKLGGNKPETFEEE